MSAPILLRGLLQGRELVAALRRIKIKKSDVKRVVYANGATLVLLKKRVKNRPPKTLIPSRALEEEMIETDRFCTRYRLLIEEERIAEIEAQLHEIRTLCARDREFFGRAILELSARFEGEKFHYYLVRFSRAKPIETEIGVGDVVLVSRGDPLQSDLTGTLYDLKKHYITVAFDHAPPAWLYRGTIRVDLFINDVTYKRMEENLERLRHAQGRERELRALLLGMRRPAPAILSQEEYSGDGLNPTQTEALKLAMGSRDFALVHGPPGTGKTRTLVALIEVEAARGHRILATADSNVAVDNMLLRLSEKGLKIVRIGHPVRITEQLQRFSIHYLYERHIETEAIKMGWEQIKAMAKEREAFSKPTPARSRGLGQERIRTLAARGKSHRGISPETMASMASWIKIDRKISKLAEDLRSREEGIYRKIIQEAQVVLATNSMAASQMMEGIRFDLAAIDEGSQQMLPSTLIAIMKAERFVIAGDHRQLPPTVVSQTPALTHTLFEALIERHPDLARMLRIEYRMHEKIMGFSNERFYDGKLIADESVRRRTLHALGVAAPGRYGQVLDPDAVLIWYDTAALKSEERRTERSGSYANEAEARIVCALVETLCEMGVKEEQIGIITPYSAQVKEIKKRLEARELFCETSSVDGFQGREKEVILISFVRANREGRIGFLRDPRRLNVALTRARSKLVCIGDLSTLGSDPLYRDLLAYIRRKGRVVEASQEE